VWLGCAYGDLGLVAELIGGRGCDYVGMRVVVCAAGG